MEEVKKIHEISWTVRVGQKQVIRKFTAEDLDLGGTDTENKEAIRKKLSEVIKETILDNFITSAQYLITGGTDKTKSTVTKKKPVATVPAKTKKPATPPPIKTRKEPVTSDYNQTKKDEDLLKAKLDAIKKGGKKQ